MGQIRLIESAAGDVPAPPAGSVSVFLDSATGVPAYKDPADDVTSLKGAPAGGTTGQALVKASNADYDVAWADQSGGSSPAHDSAAWETAIDDLAPVHWWKCDEASGDFADSGSAGSLPLTASGTITYHAADPWGGTSAAEFTTTGPGKGTSSGLGSIPTGSNPRTILLLFRCLAPQPQSSPAIVWYGTASTRQAFFYQLNSRSGEFGDIFDLWDDSTANHAAPKAGDGAWHLLALAIFNTRFMCYWLDGQTVAKTTSGNPATTGGSFTLNPDGSDLYIADAAVFTTWLGTATLAKLWDIIRAEIA